MEWLHTLFFGNGIAHAVLTFALVITIGILLGKVKIGGVSLGITWILFVGIVLSHFGMTVDGEVRHFVQEFGLILFVFSIGLQVGPGFFASFKHGGMTLVMCAVAIVLLGVATAYVVHLVHRSTVPMMLAVRISPIPTVPIRNGIGSGSPYPYFSTHGITRAFNTTGGTDARYLLLFRSIHVRYAATRVVRLPAITSSIIPPPSMLAIRQPMNSPGIAAGVKNGSTVRASATRVWIAP